MSTRTGETDRFTEWRTPALVVRLVYLEDLEADPNVGDNFFRQEVINEIRRELAQRATRKGAF